MNDFIDSFAYWLADYYMATTVLLAAALVLIRLCRQPVKRLAVAKAAVVAAAALAGLCALPGWSVIHLLAARQSAEPSEVVEQPITLVPVEGAMPDTAQLPTVTTSSLAAPITAMPQTAFRGWAALSLAAVAAGLYAVGSATVLVWLIWGALAARRLVQGASPAADELNQLLPGRDALRWCGIVLRASGAIDVPVAVGVWRPTVLLPSGWVQEYSPDELRAVLAHEAAHVENGDLKWLAAGRGLLVLLWAQPFVWWLRRSMRLDQESLADAAAAEVSNRRQYAEQLVVWARDFADRPRSLSPAALGLWEGPSQLRRRIALLLDEQLTVLRRCPRLWVWGTSTILLVLSAVLSAATFEPANSAQAEVKPPASEAATIHTGVGPGTYTATIHTGVGPGTLTAFVPGAPPTPPDSKPSFVAFSVQDETGTPLASADVTVYCVRQFDSGPEVAGRTSTNERGEVEFGDLVSAARAAEYQSLNRNGQFPESANDIYYFAFVKPQLATLILPASEFTIATQGLRRTLRMRPAAELNGRVTDREGKPVVGAVVAAGGMAGALAVEGINAVRSDGDGRYRFSNLAGFDRAAATKRETDTDRFALQVNRVDVAGTPETYDPANDTTVSDLSVSHPDYAVTTVRGGDVPGETDVVMAPAASIEGRVIDFATGKPAADVQVKALGHVVSPESKDMFWRVGSALPRIGSMHAATTRTDAEGRYRLTNLPAGRYDVWAQAPNREIATAEWLCRGVGGLQVDAQGRASAAPDLVIGPGATVRGQLVDAGGKPLSVGGPGSTLQVVGMFVDGPNQQALPVQRVSLSPDGKFEVRAYPGKLRLFVMVLQEKPDGRSEVAYRSDDETMQWGPVLDLQHGDVTNAEFRVLPEAELNASQSSQHRAFVLMNEQKFAEAIAAFTELIAKEPRNVPACTGRGNAYEYVGRLPEALADFERVVELRPDDAGMKLRVADLLATSNDAMIRDGRRALALANEVLGEVRRGRPNPDSESMALRTLAAAQAETGDFDAAEATQQAAIELAPEAWRVEMRKRLKLYESREPYHRQPQATQMNLIGPRSTHSEAMAATTEMDSARTLVIGGRYQEAIEKLDRFIKENPNVVGARMIRAEARDKLGQIAQLIAEYDELLRLEPPAPIDFIARNNLAFQLATAADEHLRDGQRAVRLAEEAIKLAGQSTPDLYDTLAAAYAESGDFDEAVATQLKAMELASGQQQNEMRTRLELYEAQQPYHQRR